MRQKLSGLIFTFLIISIKSIGQCPSVDFVVPDSLCIGENINITNNSINADSIEWDFCAGDLFNIPSSSLSTSISGLNNPRSYTMIHTASGWYGFSMSITDNNLFRLSFGNDPSSIPIVDNMGNIDNKFNRPIPIVFTRYNQNWYGFVHNGGLSNIVRLDFGTDLNTTPITSDVVSSVGGDFSNMDIGLDSGNYFLLLSNYGTNTFSTIKLGNSPLNIPQLTDVITTPAVPGANFLDVKLYKNCNNWIGFAVGYGNKKIYSLDFNYGLANLPVITELTGYNLGTDAPTKFSVARDLGKYMLFISTESGHLFRAVIGNNILNNSLESFDDMGNLTAGSSPFGFSLSQYGSRWIAYMLSSNAGLYAISFPDNCSANQSTSGEYVPNSVSYSAPGTYYLSGTGFSSNGNFQAAVDTIIVKNTSSPPISFSTLNACLANPNNFSASSPGDSVITSWTWNFGDGSPAANGQNVNYQYPAIGRYLVTLGTQTTSGCVNSVSDSIRIYNAPVASFIMPLVNLCTNSQLSFTNTSAGLNSDSIHFTWNFNNESLSNDVNGLYTFSTPGIKNISLAAEITGCIDSVSQQLNIDSGPFAAFSWTQNCWDASNNQSTPLFINNSDTSNVSYNWNFGDGSPASSMLNPSHIFAGTGNFAINLTATDTTNGCTTVTSDSIIISDSPLAAFQFDSFISENIPASFHGADLTNSPDSIISWNWQFDSLGTSIIKDPFFTFSIPGNYSVTLSYQSLQQCAYDTTQIISVNGALCPSISFVIPDSVCFNETILIYNNSINTDSVIWDFCAGDLFGTPLTGLSSTVSGASNIRSFSMVHSASGWYAFSTSISDNKLYRFNFGTDPSSIPAVDDLGNPDNKLSRPIPVALVQDNGNWSAFVHNGGPSNIIRLDFGIDLGSTPFVTELIDSIGDDFSNMDIGLDSGIYSLVLSSFNSNQISIIRLGNSPTGIPQSSDILLTPSTPGAGFLDVKLFKNCNNWYGFAAGYNSRKIYRLDFLNGLANLPAITELGGYDLGAGNPTRITIAEELGKYLCFIVTESGELFRGVIGNNIDNNIFETIESLGNISGNNNSFSLSLSKNGSRNIFHSFTSNGNLYITEFPDHCSASQPISNLFQPSDISYSSPGTYYPACYGFTANNNYSVTFDTLIIKNTEASSVSFTTENACLGKSNDFIASSSEDSLVISWTWDFGDGSSPSTGQFIAHQFNAAGNFPVTVTIQTLNGCGNFSMKEVPIYMQPVPGFTTSPNTLCSNDNISFINSTLSSAPDSISSFQWNLNNEAVLNAKDTSYLFTTGGLKNITLTVSIPGCIADTTRIIDVLEGPVASFSSVNECDEVPVIYQNTSTGDISSYSWDFGDGYTSTLPDPVHTFTSPGSYGVNLSVTNSSGCISNINSNTNIYYYPEAGFQNDLPCTGIEIMFYDTSSVVSANIISYSWNINNVLNPAIEKNSTLKDPVFNFNQPGEYAISLNVESNYGCRDSVSRIISLLPSPVPDFFYINNCYGDSTFFQDQSESMDTSLISQWTWNINGSIIESKNFGYLFDNPGNYLVNLSVRSDNRCVSDTVKTVVINSLPDVSFTVENQCTNQTIFFHDNSSITNDSLTRYYYEIESAGSSIGPEFSHRFDSGGTYGIKYTVISAHNCTSTITDSIKIYNAPHAEFESIPAYGAVPLFVEFSNRSTNAELYSWNFGENSFQISTEINPNHIYESTGSFQVLLKAINQLGCQDSAFTEILVENPYYDIALNKISRIESNGTLRFILDIKNIGTVKVENMDIIIHINNDYSISEPFEYPLFAGDSVSHLLNFVLVQGHSIPPQYICFDLSPHVEGNVEQNITNNTECYMENNEFRIIDPYPNPVSDELIIPFLLPIKSEINFQLFNPEGKMVLENNFTEAKTGYNIIKVDTRPYRPGMYILNLRGSYFSDIRKIIITR